MDSCGIKLRAAEGTSLTVTEQVAVLLPSAVLTVIVAEAAAWAVTIPPVETVATDGLLDAQETPLLVALLGDTEAYNLDVCPTVNDNDVGDTDTPVTEIVAFFTVTEHVAVLLPSAVLTVIIAVPEAMAVTVPLE